MKVRICSDNYKLEKFKEELIKNGYTDFKITPFIENTSIIKVEIREDEISKFKNVCTLVELYFKQRN